MSAPMTACGCRIHHWPKPMSYKPADPDALLSIDYCPLHAAAGRMRDEMKECLRLAGIDFDAHYIKNMIADEDKTQLAGLYLGRLSVIQQRLEAALAPLSTHAGGRDG